MGQITAKEVLEKQPAESILYRFDFTDLLGTSETIASVSSVTADTTAITVGTGAVAATTFTRNNGESGSASKSVTVRVSGGSSGLRTRLECIVVTSSTNIRELDGILVVRD